MGGEELRVALHALDGFREAAWKLLHRELPPLLRCQLVDILVHRLPDVYSVCVETSCRLLF